MGNDMQKVGNALASPFTAPVHLVQDVFVDKKNVFDSVAAAVTSLATAPINVAVGIAAAATSPLPVVQNAVHAAGSVLNVAISAPIDLVAKVSNGVVNAGEGIAKGDNVGHSLGKGVFTFVLGSGAEGARVLRTLIDETVSVLQGKESQRRQSEGREWGARVLVYDDTGSNSLDLPEATWQYGDALFNARRFTHRIPAKTWADALHRLSDVARHAPLSELQFWGHGSVAQAHIGADVFSAATLETEEFRQFAALAPFRDDGTGLVWFRTCQTLGGGEAGREFARALSGSFPGQRVRVAGHTVDISRPNPLKHPGLVQYDPADGSWREGGDILATDVSPDFLQPIYVP